MLRLHNLRLLDYLRFHYTLADVARLDEFLHSAGTFHFPALSNGLYPAAHLSAEHASGYANVWIRDNVYVAHALLVDGQVEAGAAVVSGLAQFLTTQQSRIANILDRSADHSDPMQRPHIRFDGHALAELDETWPHAQNDALGYFLWLAARSISAGTLSPTDNLLQVITAVALFLEAIDFPRDEDSGHWEETRKQNMSSIGAATAGLRELLRLVELQPELLARLQFHGHALSLARLQTLVEQGLSELSASLPHECRDLDPLKRREADAALLFLICPLEIVTERAAGEIVELVKRDLAGDIGVRRYRGDSYWCGDYKAKLAPNERSADFSNDIGSRDALLKPGEEAQWCIFDPILSIIAGRQYQQTYDPAQLAEQTYFFNRSLAHLTADDSPFGGLRCPESYYLEHGRYVPVDQTPLLWTQANLLVALHELRRSLKIARGAK